MRIRTNYSATRRGIKKKRYYILREVLIENTMCTLWYYLKEDKETPKFYKKLSINIDEVDSKALRRVVKEERIKIMEYLYDLKLLEYERNNNANWN